MTWAGISIVTYIPSFGGRRVPSKPVYDDDSWLWTYYDEEDRD